MIATIMKIATVTTLCLRRWFLLATLVFALPAFADPPISSCEGYLSGSEEQVYHAFFENYARNYEDGLGVRGFFGSAVPNTPYTVELAMEYGLTWWGMKWNFAASVEEAVEHRLKARALHEEKGTTFTDVIVAGQYFIGDESELGITFSEDGPAQIPVPAEKVRELISRGAYEVDHLGQVTYISPERLARRISPNSMTYNNVSHLPGTFGKNSLSQSGWVAFKQHGIHDYSKWKNSESAKKLKKLAIKLAEKGYTIRFNTDYEAMLDKIKNQTRTYRDRQEGEKGESVVGERKEHRVSDSRYSNPTVYNTALGLLKAGRGYSVGLYNEKGELVGGEIGFRSGNHLYGDSVFYDQVEYAKIAALALFEVLDVAGMPYSDPGMITPYTASMGAELIPFPEYLQKIKSGPQQKIELPSEWDPRPADHLATSFQAIAGRKNQGLGNLKIARRLPADSEEARAEAARFGLQRATLNLVLVKSAEEAGVHVQSGIEWADTPIYIEMGGDKVFNTNDSAVELLRGALADANTKVYFIGSPKYPDSRKPIPVKQLQEFLNLDLALDPPVWVEGASKPTISVSGWGFSR